MTLIEEQEAKLAAERIWRLGTSILTDLNILELQLNRFGRLPADQQKAGQDHILDETLLRLYHALAKGQYWKTP